MGAVHTQRTIAWNLVPTTDFEATVRFFEAVMGWEMKQRGVPVHDLQFQRYAMFHCPNGVVMEVVEPSADCAARFTGPVLAITVDDLLGMKQRIEATGVLFDTDVIYSDDGSAWTYFDLPGAGRFQLMGVGVPKPQTD